MKQKEPPLPDHLRCNRSDGRDWRCARRVMDGKKLCGIHYLQLRHRQHKEKVPDVLKIQRKRKRGRNQESGSGKNPEIRAARVKGRESEAKKTESVGNALKRVKLKKGDVQLDLIRSCLQRQVLRRRKDGFEEGSGGEWVRDLPNGVMSISSAPLPQRIGIAESCKIKLGVDATSSSPPQRQFRSKNIQPLPISTMKVVPSPSPMSPMNTRKTRRMKCHWCQKSYGRKLIRCSKCWGEAFCVNCIRKQYFDTEDRVRISCPVCRQTCSCKPCLLARHEDDQCKKFQSDKDKVYRILHFHYLICKLLPVLEQINHDQNIELESEARMRGKTPSEIKIHLAEYGCKRNFCCNSCENSIVDFHRSCPNCSYTLCLSCSKELFRGSLHAGNNLKLRKCSVAKIYSNYVGEKLLEMNQTEALKQESCEKSDVYFEFSPTGKASNDDCSVACPPTEYGGCANGLLELKSLFPLNWTKNLEASAEEIMCSYDFPDTFETSSCCSLCIAQNNKGSGNKQVEAAAGEDSSENFLFCPSVQDIRHDNLEHFQKHWAKGHPVLIRSVIPSVAKLTWDPVLMFCNYLEKNIAKLGNDLNSVKANSFLDWFEVEIGIRETFSGSLRGYTHANTQHDMLKLKGWLSSSLFQEYFPDYYAEIIHRLPLQEYLNPNSGLLNLIANSPLEVPEAEHGPCISISYGSSDRPIQSDYVTNLCYDSHDVVNILVHAANAPLSATNISKLKKLMKKYKAQDQKKPAKIAAACKGASIPKQESPLPNGNGVLSHSDDDSDATASMPYPDASESTSEDEVSCVGHIGNSNLSGKSSTADADAAQWDVFRRQDVPTLVEYLKRQSNEFNQTHNFAKHLVHPILDKIFFLDAADKLKLKEEFDIEPWTFKQRIGEAVIIPAGCPYQIKNLKSCVNVVLDFVSPENITKSIELIDEFQLLPEHRKSQKAKRELKKLTLYSINTAIKELRELMSSDSRT